MKGWGRGFTAGVACLTIAGCQGYCPLRWPNQALWKSPATNTAIEILTDLQGASPASNGEEGVFANVEFLDASHTAVVFRANLLQHGIQPLMISIANQGVEPVRFSQTSLDQQRVSAVAAAHTVDPLAIRAAATQMRWIMLFLPGLVFDSIVEPLTTLEFPVLKEAAQRPPRRSNLQAAYVRAELSEGEVLPGQQRQGVVFIRALGRGHSLTLTLTRGQSLAPLAFTFEPPSALYAVQEHMYNQPYDKVWDVVVRTAQKMPSWRVLAIDAEHRQLTVRRRFRFIPLAAPWDTRSIRVEPTKWVEAVPQKTKAASLTFITREGVQVTMLSSMPVVARSSAAPASKDQTIDSSASFFQALNAALVPQSETAGATPTQL